MIRVIKPGALSQLQDLGRYGHQRYGVPVNGVMDEWSHRIANILVGNPDSTATLECTLTGPVLRFTRDRLIALSGADLRAHVDDMPVPLNQPLLVRAGATLAFGERRRGARVYLAVRGGFDVPAVMDSRSTFLRGGYGGFQGRALVRGDNLPLCAADAGYPAATRLLVQSGTPFVPAALFDLPAGRFDLADVRADPPAVQSESFTAQVGPSTAQDGPPAARVDLSAAADMGNVLRVMPGPQWDFFTEASRAVFYEQAFEIDQRSDRMGYRLKGARMEFAQSVEMISEAVSSGTVQVPPDGNPIILMSDRQSAGGYPKIAYVASVDLPLLAQALPGETVRFVPVTLAQAQARYLEREQALAVLRAKVEQAMRPLHVPQAAQLIETGAERSGSA